MKYKIEIIVEGELKEEYNNNLEMIANKAQLEKEYPNLENGILYGSKNK